MSKDTPDPAVLSDARALKPCPFCGAEARRLTIDEDEPNNAGGDVIVCTRCQASSHVEFGRKENLASFWNRRIVDDLVATISNFAHSGDDGFNFDRDPDDDRYTLDSLIEQARHLRATPPATATAIAAGSDVLTGRGDGTYAEAENAIRLLLAIATKAVSDIPASVIEALRGITDDYQTSAQHHPNHVLIPTAKFEQLRAAAEAIDAQ